MPKESATPLSHTSGNPEDAPYRPARAPKRAADYQAAVRASDIAADKAHKSLKPGESTSRGDRGKGDDKAKSASKS